MNIYRKRQLGAALVLAVLIFSIVGIVRCSSGKKDGETVQTGIDNGTDVEITVPNIDVSELEEINKDNVPVEHVFSDRSEIPFIDVNFSPDDISLIDAKYLKDVVIIGDSIAKGYSVYGRLEDDNVLAVGSIGVRNVLETQFDYQGFSLEITDILNRRKPKYIFISLGMNDINIHSEEEFTNNYRNFIEEIKKVTPDSKIIVTAITPVTYGNKFTQNEKIDTYNEALRKMVFDYNSDKIFFVNAAQYIKDSSNNGLISKFTSGDGIHLSAEAYDYLLTYMLMMLEWI